MKIYSREHKESYLLVNIGVNQQEVQLNASQVHRYLNAIGLNTVAGLELVGDNGATFEITYHGASATRKYTLKRK